MKIIGLILLHAICIYFLQLLWKDKSATIQRGGALTKMGYVSKKKSSRLFYFSVWVDFVGLCILDLGLVVYPTLSLFR